ncbi:MAG: histidine kinase N-terminal 7TM domain-containing protein, partial [Dehalococcoidales bacterium]|nr:histidine kinase N-terminal 7TM domain-containing protein [Dehalococcoidales bacterium]
MSFYVLIPVILFAFCIGLLFLVTIAGLRHTARRPFSIFLIFMAFWGFFIFMMRYSRSLDVAYMWEKWVFLSITSVSLSFYQFTLSVTNIKERRAVRYTIFLLYCGSLILIPTGLVVKRMQMMWYGKAPIIGPLFFLYVFAVYVPIVRAMVILIKHYKQTKVLNEKVRDSYLVLGI